VGKAIVLLGRPSNRKALALGVGGGIEHDAVLRSLQSLATVIDVGANRGQFSLAVRHFHARARIIAFEPLAQAAAVYRRVFAGDGYAELHQSAVGTSAGKATMQRSGREDSSSLLPISELMPQHFPGTGAIGVEEVPIAPLTKFVTAADLQGTNLLKIDVQGYELEVLRSAQPLLAHIDRVYVEASFVPFYDGQPLAAEVIDYLHAHDFVLEGFMNPSFHAQTGMPIQADLLFANLARQP
jgi:FkbM family methyltransferase